MPSTTQHAPGTFCWPELATSDQAGAKQFYSGLFGWTMNDTDMGNNEFYTMIELGGRSVGALYTMRKEEAAHGAPPHWNSYVSVEGADAAASKAKQLGGTVLMDAFDVMDVGRMAVIQDPTGAIFCVWQAKKHAGAGVLNEVGSLVWTELLTNDTDKAAQFYTGLFPWKAEAQNMSMPYTIFQHGERGAGGMMKITPEMGPIPPNWMVYFSVTDADATVAKAVKLGGKPMMPAFDVPTVGRIAILQDPQGAVFAIIKTMPQS